MNKEDVNQNIFNKTLIKKSKDVSSGLEYYIKRVEELEIENKRLQEMYDNRVNEYIKLQKENS